MKNLTLIIAMLLIAFTVDAQSTRTRTSDDRKKETPSVSRSSSPSKSTATRTESRSGERAPASRPASSSVSRSSGNSSNSGTSRQSGTSVNRQSSGSERSSGATRSDVSTRPTPPRQSSQSGNATRTQSSSQRSDDRSGVSRDSRSSNSGYVREQERSAGNDGRTRTVEGNSNRSSQSVRGGTNVYTPRNSSNHAEQRRTYTTYMPDRVRRTAPTVHYSQRPLEYRRVHYVYREPRVMHIYWDVHMYHEYRTWYPHYDLWYYPYGYRIHTISAYDAYRYIGEIARVYGEVFEVWYERQTDKYFLYIGGPYPYNDFTVILDGWDARRFSRNPERFFTRRHIEVTGLVSSFDGKPEIDVRNKKQVRPY